MPGGRLHGPRQSEAGPSRVKAPPWPAGPQTRPRQGGGPLGDELLPPPVADQTCSVGASQASTGKRGPRLISGDAGLVHLSGLALSSLNLRGTGVTAYGTGSLPSGSLEALHLTDTKVSGEELFRLPPMPRFAVLKLNFLEIDDASIEALCLYPSLRHVELDQTAVSDAGLRRLLALNP